MKQQLYNHLAFLYGEEQAAILAEKFSRTLVDYVARYPELAVRRAIDRVSERDSVLITYGDMVQEPDKAPLRSLADFLAAHISGTVSTVHILPFFPYSSDDGFSVIDYVKVDPALGNWADAAQVGQAFRLMFDAVVNHVSAHSEWFQSFLEDDPRYRDYFTVVDPEADLSQVFRPRTLPLLTEVETTVGVKQVWTTFSTDQIDLNYADPNILLEVISILLFYVAQGAEFIRLDAIAFIWKEIGTSCIHLPQTHEIIRLMRTILNRVAPHVTIITETNVPHDENISYFGDGSDEAQMVYNFSLPPLTLNAFHVGRADKLSAWAKTLWQPSKETTFFNFLASHDGIGLTPARDLLSDREILAMAARVEALGGTVSYRASPDGTMSAYELNVNYLDALGDPAQPSEDLDLVTRRFIASQAIMLSLQGVPGIYFHSLFGSRNWVEGMRQTGRSRSINREKFQRASLEAGLMDKGSLQHMVFTYYCRLLKARTAEPAFHPNGMQKIFDLDPAIFAIQRTSQDGRSMVMCLHNVSSEIRQIQLPEGVAPANDLLTCTEVGNTMVGLAPYEVLWLHRATGTP